MKTPKVDLSATDPKGRLDVVAYRGVELLAKKLEAHYGMSGIWDAISPHVNDTLVDSFRGLELPKEANILLQILQSNMQKKKEGL